MNVLNAAIISRLGTTAAITALLAGGTVGTSIFSLQAPPNATLPYIIFNIQGGGDLNDNPHRTKNLVVFIRAYSSVSAKSAGSIDAQIDTALHMNPFTNVSGWTNTWLAREDDLEIVENPPTGTQVFMQGGLYRNRLTK